MTNKTIKQRVNQLISEALYENDDEALYENDEASIITKKFNAEMREYNKSLEALKGSIKNESDPKKKESLKIKWNEMYQDKVVLRRKYADLLVQAGKDRYSAALSTGLAGQGGMSMRRPYYKVGKWA